VLAYSGPAGKEGGESSEARTCGYDGSSSYGSDGVGHGHASIRSPSQGLHAR
jgi:hypothetical protein